MQVSSRLFAFVPVEKRPFFMQAGVAGLGLSNPAPVRIGACRAVAQFCPHVGAGGLGDMATPLYQVRPSPLIVDWPLSWQLVSSMPTP